MRTLHLRTLASICLLALLGSTVGGCELVGSGDVPDPEDGVGGEALFEALIQFESRLDQPLQHPFYGGVSFGGGKPTSDHLTIFLLGSEKRGAARAALRAVFGEETAERITIRVWTSDETVASEELKRELPIFETAESATSLDYDERIDRLSVGVRDLGDVGALERLLARRNLPREAMVIQPGHYACTLEARPGLAVEVTSTATGRPVRAAGLVGVATDGAFTDTLRGGYSERAEAARLFGAIERAGTYDVRIEAEGFEAWTREGVEVGENRCHVETVELSAELAPVE